LSTSRFFAEISQHAIIVVEAEMVNYIQEIIQLLLQAPGNLVYHLVLTFSVVTALAISLNNWRFTGTAESKRMVFGLSALFLAQMLLFVIGALSWQGLINGSILLPPLDRSVNLVSLVIISWMWIFPQPSRLGDAATILLILIVGTVFSLSLVWWSGGSASSDFNGTLPDQMTSMLSLAIATIAMLLLAIRRPVGWGFGIGMIGLLLIGDVAHLTFPYPEGDISGAARLAQLIAYPMLLILPLRFPVVATETQLDQKKALPDQGMISSERKSTGTEQQLISLLLESGSPDFYNHLAKAIAQQWKADLCMLVSPPDAHGKMQILSCYDLIREQYIGNAVFNSQSIPVIASALRRGRALRLPASSTSPDLVGLGKLLDMKSVGHLLAAPVSNQQGELLVGIILLTPYSKRGWSTDDQLKLTEFAEPLAQVLQHSSMILTLRNDQDQAKKELYANRQELENFREENRLLLERLGIAVDDDDKQRAHVASLAALIAVHEEAQDKIAQLQAENTRLLQESGGLAEYNLVSQGQPTDNEYKLEITHAEGELRLALEEVARLNSQIYEADKKLLELSREAAISSPSRNQMREISKLAQELRQPMSSILGYTDFLLAETTGILGTMQRRFLERIRVSTDRMRGLIDELIQLAGVENSQIPLAPEFVDLGSVIDEAIAGTSEKMRQKNIALRLDLPKLLPQLRTSRAPLRRLLEVLLESASDVTRVNGEIELRVRLKGDQDTRDFVLIQVIDQGDGIKSEDMARIFAAHEQMESEALVGLGENREGLSILKSLAESLGGRIWVDTESGMGSSVSLLFPVSAEVIPDYERSGVIK
jgi:signal transduction histidine kinase